MTKKSHQRPLEDACSHGLWASANKQIGSWVDGVILVSYLVDDELYLQAPNKVSTQQDSSSSKEWARGVLNANTPYHSRLPNAKRDYDILHLRQPSTSSCRNSQCRHIQHMAKVPRTGALCTASVCYRVRCYELGHGEVCLLSLPSMEQRPLAAFPRYETIG